MDQSPNKKAYDDVRGYYGKELSTSKDLKTNACCTDPATMPDEARVALSEIHEEVLEKY